MTFVVSAECENCEEKLCVGACSVDAFFVPVEVTADLPARTYISPETCIDCAACVGDCEHQAIYPEDELPAEHAADLELNKLCDEKRELFRLAHTTADPSTAAENARYTKTEYGV